ncbi:MAG: ESPR domain-containing protein, partial [Dialister micraerophilus]|nr:ESPR domain-containing protein [Dialister micraerophilus]
MNKTYKLVWSKVRNAWVVTSEIAKGHGKESSSGRNGKRLKLAVMTAILGGCFMTAGVSPVAAALTHDQQVVYDAVMTQLKASGKVELGGTTEDTTGIAIGKDSSTSHHMGVAIGEGAKTDNQGNVAIGHKSYS